MKEFFKRLIPLALGSAMAALMFLPVMPSFATKVDPRDVPLASVAGGYSGYTNIDIDESVTGQAVKNTPGRLYRCDVINDTAATKEYLKIYNATEAGTTVGTTTPRFTYPLAPAGVKTTIDFGQYGVAFTNGITLAATTGIAASDTGAPAANAVVVNCLYK